LTVSEWKIKVGYGKRWMVETAFSCIKRIFGEYVMAKKWLNMIKEMLFKKQAYTIFL